MKEVPTKLLEYQDQVRMETEQKVRCAIEELKAEGYTVRIKDLVEYTGPVSYTHLTLPTILRV